MAEINVDVWDATGNKRTPVALPDDVPVSQVIYELIKALQLPEVGPDGMPLSYKFHHKRSGRQLGDEETLAVAHVAPDDVLRLQPEITAGSNSRGGE